MPTILTLFTVSTFLWIFYQDMRSREIYLLSYLVLYVLFIIHFLVRNFVFLHSSIIINIWIVFAVYSLLAIYYVLKYKRLVFKKLKSAIGMGDILMLPAFIFFFSPINFIIIYILSLLIALVYSAVNYRSGIVTIPLAGIQAFIFSVCLLLHHNIVNFQVDNYLLF